MTLGKAAEGRRSPRRRARHDDFRNTQSVLECASPLALCEKTIYVARFLHEPLCANDNINCYNTAAANPAVGG
jgi:hypothetical protein